MRSPGRSMIGDTTVPGAQEELFNTLAQSVVIARRRKFEASANRASSDRVRLIRS